MAVEQIELNDYVKREEEGSPPPRAVPEPLPPPPGTGGYGPLGQAIYSAFQPAPPGTDPMSFMPTDLLRQLRQGIVSDEDLAEIKRHPFGLTAAAAAANAAIMLSRGAGGEGAGELPRGAVPAHVWNSWEVVKPGQWDVHGAAVPKPAGEGAIRVDEAGNHYQLVGSHTVGEGSDRKTNYIVQPVEPPTGPAPGSPEWFQQKAVDFQAKHGLPPPETPPEFKGPTFEEFYGGNPKRMSDPKAREIYDQYIQWLKDQVKLQPPLPPQGPRKVTDEHGQDWKITSPPPPETPPGAEAQKGPPPFKNPDPKAASIEDAFQKKQPISAFDAETHYIQGKNYAEWMKDFGWTKKGDFYVPPEGHMLQEEEKVGPVDWNWYQPQGGANPPYQPPFEVPPGWAPEDMGAHTSDFWDRFGWTPPPDPNSPDFPGPNRWDYKPPPE